MTQRGDTTKWLCYILAISACPLWNSVKGITAKPPPSPSTVQAQAKFFQDFFSVQLSPYKIEFGHVCEDPHTWEQRYEKKDFKNHRDMGKVRWGDKKGGYGEHYWDLNHAGHAGNHDDHGYEGDSDDGSYHVTEKSHDPYNGHNDHSSYDDPRDHSYGNDDYDPESGSSYEENGRAKRAHSKAKPENNHPKEYHEREPEKRRHRKHNTKNVELEAAPSHDTEEYSDEDDKEDQEVNKKVKKRPQHKHKHSEDQQPNEEKKQVVLIVKEKDDEENRYVSNQHPTPSHYVNYEDGAGVRQHQQPEVSAASVAPRLFLDHSTGRVVDRATGQAYILQPIINHQY